MITLADLRPGDIMFGPMGGFFPGVIPVAAGQLLLAERKERMSWRRWWNVRHVGVVTQAVLPIPSGTTHENEHGIPVTINGNFSTPPLLVEAMPGGAREVALTEARWTPEYVYVRPRYSDDPGYTDTKRGRAAAAAARRYVSTPYSYLDYVALAARAVGLEYPSLNRFIKNTGHMICSQLADQALCDAGYHVFNDGRLPQDVVPAELFRALLDAPGTQYVVPGMPAWAEAPSYWR